MKFTGMPVQLFVEVIDIEIEIDIHYTVELCTDLYKCMKECVRVYKCSLHVELCSAP